MANPSSDLKKLMAESENKEIECRKYLEHFRERLVRNTPIRFLRFDPEYRGHCGDSDLIVSCEVENDAGVKCTEAYVWEIKAPQCYAFEYDNNNRIKPTADLIKAENQLLHYFEEYRKSEQFKSEFGITSSDNIHLGGIIISQKCNLVKPHKAYTSQAKVDSLYTRAIECRKGHFYKASRIDFLIWDKVADFISCGSSKTGEIKQMSATIKAKSNLAVSSTILGGGS